MILLYVILIVLALFSMRPLKDENRYNPDYISKDTCNVIKGICIWMVFIRHISSYMTEIPTFNSWDHTLFDLDYFIRQLLVVPFLFYSGYGVTVSLNNKGGEYANKIPTKRVLSTLVNFDIAVIFFVIMNISLGDKLEFKQILLALTGWESVRNSNWYIFCILICYIISWASYKLAGMTRQMLLLIWMSILLYTAILYFYKGHWWYDTIYAYGVGAIFAFYKDKSEKIIKSHYSVLLIASIAGFFTFYTMPNYFSISANITAVFLCFIIVLFTLKVRLKSSILSWSGQHLFPLYIYQRLPMVILSTISGGAFMNEHYYMYVVICFVITILIAAIYGYVNNLDVKKLVICRKRI